MALYCVNYQYERILTVSEIVFKTFNSRGYIKYKSNGDVNEEVHKLGDKINTHGLMVRNVFNILVM